MSINISLCLQIVYVCKGLFFRLCYDDSVQAEAVFSWRPDVAVLEAGRGQSRRKTRASWRPDAGALEAGRRVKLFLGSTVPILPILVV